VTGCRVIECRRPREPQSCTYTSSMLAHRGMDTATVSTGWKDSHGSRRKPSSSHQRHYGMLCHNGQEQQCAPFSQHVTGNLLRPGTKLGDFRLEIHQWQKIIANDPSYPVQLIVTLKLNESAVTWYEENAPHSFDRIITSLAGARLATQRLIRGDHDLFAILPTAGGKTLLCIRQTQSFIDDRGDSPVHGIVGEPDAISWQPRHMRQGVETGYNPDDQHHAGSRGERDERGVHRLRYQWLLAILLTHWPLS